MGLEDYDDKFKYFINSDDHNPPHVHVRSKTTGREYRFEIETAEFISSKNNPTFSEYGISKIKKKIKRNRVKWLEKFNNINNN